MRILLIQNDPSLREKVTFSLDATFKAQTVESNNVFEAGKILDEDPSFDLAILDSPTPSLQELGKLKAKLNRIPYILCVQDKKSLSGVLKYNPSAILERQTLIESILQQIKNLISNGILPEEQEDRNFCKIRTRMLISVCPLMGDIYIKLSESKYLKLFHSGEEFDLNDMEKYAYKKGIEYLYIRKDDVGHFIEKYNNDLKKFLAKDYPLNVDEAIDQNESIYETVQELGNRYGFSKDVQIMAGSSIKMSLKVIEKKGSLSKVLEKIKSSEGRYITTHSVMCGYLACAIASHLEWGSETTFHKLSLAAFLHDIVLEDQKSAAMETLEQAKSEGLTADQIRAIELHPIRGAEIASRFSEIPPDVDQIILQHHERPDGSGFPRGLTQSNISPLAATFIVAHELTTYTLKHGYSSHLLREFISKMSKKYPSRKFLNAIEAVKGL